MKLGNQIMAYGLAGALLAAGVGAIGIVATDGLGVAIGDSIQAAHALQTSQRADMTHDAIRGDSQLALLGVLQAKADQVAEADKALQEHARVFDEALTELQQMTLSEESQRQLATVRTLVQKYVAAAQRLIEGAKVNVASAEKEAPGLQAAFTELEGHMALLSESVAKSGDALNAQSTQSVGLAKLAIGVALALALAGMVGLGLVLSGRMTRPMAQAVRAADRLAQGDLSAEIRPAGNDEIVQLLEAMKRMQGSFATIVRTVKANAESVSVASAQIAQGNNDLSSRTESQASALQQTAASMEQLSDTVRQNAANARQGNQLAQGASSVAARGGEVVSQVVETMKGINDSSKKIADIIGVIDGIAFQTNILALNAAVEAARAGEQGRGFAVVASEVRSLAQRSAAAAREIKGLIGASVERVEHGSALVGQAGATMKEVVASIQRVTDIMGDISAASSHQSEGVAQVGEAVSQMDQATQQNAALVEESAAAAESLRGQAIALVGAVAVFKLTPGDAREAAAAY